MLPIATPVATHRKAGWGTGVSYAMGLLGMRCPRSNSKDLLVWVDCGGVEMTDKAGVWYTTRERVILGLDQGMSPELKWRIDHNIESASRRVEGTAKRIFFPRIDTVSFDWPSRFARSSNKIWLNDQELISATGVLSGGVAIPAADYFLYPTEGPPFNQFQIDLDSNSSLSVGGTYQRSFSITGLWGYTDDQVDCGALDSAINDSTSTIDVTDSSRIGVGSILKIDSERVIVQAKGWVTSGQTIQANLTASMADTSVSVTTGSEFHEGDTIQIGSEKVTIDSITGNTLTVRRARFGTVLAAHIGTTIYVSRRLIVVRGACGTTAASHLDATSVSRWIPPAGVEMFTVALAEFDFLSENAGWARTIGVGDAERESRGNSLNKLRESFIETYARKARMRSV